MEVHVVTADRWADLVALFERKGPRGGIPIPGHCWCQAWRDQESPDGPKANFKAATVDQDRHPGLIAYLDGRPVGWIAVAPRPDHAKLERSRKYGPGPDDHDVFAITCFYVDRDFRGTGVASALLDAAITYARNAGAQALDAFPKASLAPHTLANRRAEENDSFMGRRASYEARGFTILRDTGARLVMHLILSPTNPLSGEVG
ncbi:GNAT family N-acetyltransferase [Kribbella sp. NPDC058245]|uniref:GNAT family N-acetyltransferase n=1 Tax=Kribbella sp. NPDC058245 TaxID=3346399 RepID=UPI0036E05F94